MRKMKRSSYEKFKHCYDIQVDFAEDYTCAAQNEVQNHITLL